MGEEKKARDSESEIQLKEVSISAYSHTEYSDTLTIFFFFFRRSRSTMFVNPVRRTLGKYTIVSDNIRDGFVVLFIFAS